MRKMLFLLSVIFSISVYSQTMLPSELGQIFKQYDKISYKIYLSNCDVNQLSLAFFNQDVGSIKSLIGLTDEEIQIIGNSISGLRQTILNNNPNISNVMNSTQGCNSPDLSKITQIILQLKEPSSWINKNGEFISIYTNNVEKMIAGGGTNDPGGPGGLNPCGDNGCCEGSCLQMTACVLLCSLTPPPLDLACAYLCLCAYCAKNGCYKDICN